MKDDLIKDVRSNLAAGKAARAKTAELLTEITNNLEKALSHKTFDVIDNNSKVLKVNETINKKNIALNKSISEKKQLTTD